MDIEALLAQLETAADEIDNLALMRGQDRRSKSRPRSAHSLCGWATWWRTTNPHDVNEVEPFTARLRG
jgi:hypothetical protein